MDTRGVMSGDRIEMHPAASVAILDKEAFRHGAALPFTIYFLLMFACLFEIGSSSNAVNKGAQSVERFVSVALLDLAYCFFTIYRRVGGQYPCTGSERV